jgi:hypothetical protein
MNNCYSNNCAEPTRVEPSLDWENRDGYIYSPLAYLYQFCLPATIEVPATEKGQSPTTVKTKEATIEQVKKAIEAMDAERARRVEHRNALSIVQNWARSNSNPATKTVYEVCSAHYVEDNPELLFLNNQTVDLGPFKFIEKKKKKDLVTVRGDWDVKVKPDMFVCLHGVAHAFGWVETGVIPNEWFDGVNLEAVSARAFGAALRHASFCLSRRAFQCCYAVQQDALWKLECCDDNFEDPLRAVSNVLCEGRGFLIF